MIELFEELSAEQGFTYLHDGYDQYKGSQRLEDQTGVMVEEQTLVDLIDCMEALTSLYPSTNAMVDAVRPLESDPNADLSVLGDVADGDVDARLITALAAWDNWSRQSEDQLEYAVDPAYIKGAREYRLALAKQGVDGKALAQAEAEAVKAGHEYIAAAMLLIGCVKDIVALKELRADEQEYEVKYAQAAAKFYSRFLAIRTTLVIEMRKLIWAFKYETLSNSRVELESQKRSLDFRNDLLIISTDIENAKESFGADFQRRSSVLLLLSVAYHSQPSNSSFLQVV
jgi:hypothetical protein